MTTKADVALEIERDIVVRMPPVESYRIMVHIISDQNAVPRFVCDDDEIAHR